MRTYVFNLFVCSAKRARLQRQKCSSPDQHKTRSSLAMNALHILLNSFISNLGGHDCSFWILGGHDCSFSIWGGAGGTCPLCPPVPPPMIIATLRPRNKLLKICSYSGFKASYTSTCMTLVATLSTPLLDKQTALLTALILPTSTFAFLHSTRFANCIAQPIKGYATISLA